MAFVGEISKRVGWHFENLTVQLFGGVNQSFGHSHKYGLIDITDYEKHRCIEVKSAGIKSRYVLRCNQHNAHQKISAMEQADFFVDKMELYTFFYTYNLENISKLNEELGNALNANVQSLFIISNDITQKLFEHYPIHIDETDYINRIVIPQNDLNEYLNHPQAMLKTLNLCPEEYDIKSSEIQTANIRQFETISVANNKNISNDFLKNDTLAVRQNETITIRQ